jgi:hypothetical protein
VRGQGFKLALRILNGGRHGLAACCVGQAKLSRSGAVAHAKERVQYGRPIGEFGMVQELLAAMDADIYTMEAGTLLTAAMMDRDEHETMLEAACTKLYATEKLWSVANDALQITGGTGFMREYPYERILRDARINMIFEGTNQVLRMMLGSQGLRALVRGEACYPDEKQSLEGVHASFAEERRIFEELVPQFATRCRTAVDRHGKASATPSSPCTVCPTWRCACSRPQRFYRGSAPQKRASRPPITSATSRASPAAVSNVNSASL